MKKKTEKNPSISTNPKTTSGRVGRNHRGDAVWEWRTASGRFRSDIDTDRLRALQLSGLGLEGAPHAGEAGYNPYDKSTITLSRGTRRKSLDDLRRLSEHIKKSKRKK